VPGTVPVGVSQLLVNPPIGLMDPIRDEHGAFAAGDHTITDFLTTSAHGVLPAGTWPIGGTFGVIVAPTVFPVTWGYDIGYDSGSPVGFEGWTYENRFAQLVVMHQAISGAFIPVQVVDCFRVQTYIPTAFVPVSGDRIGLHVSPGISVELYFMCLLA